MLFDLIFQSQGDFRSTIVSLLLYLPMMLLALSMHEASHGYAAYKCGDNTARNLGRLTLNPLKHFDAIGALFMLIFGFGWAKAVPVNPRNFRNPKRDMAITAAAGPGANLVLGLFCTVLYGFLEAYHIYLSYTGANAFLTTCVFWLTIMMAQGALINLIFMTFNLIPLPPFDGSRIAYVLLPDRVYFGIMRYERQIMLVILLVLFALSHFFSFSPFSWVAQKLMSLIAQPIFELSLKMFSSLLA